MSLEVKARVENVVFIVDLCGLMDYSTIDGFKLNIPERIEKIQVVFSNIEFIDSTGIGAVLSIIYAAAERNLDVEFTGLNETNHELFDTVGVFKIMEALLKGGR